MWKINASKTALATAATIIGVMASVISVNAQTYGSNFFTGGWPSCNDDINPTYQCPYLTDGNLATAWLEQTTAFPHWVEYTLATGTTATLGKFYFNEWGDVGGCGVKNWSLYGSNDNVSWTQLIATTTQGNCAANLDVNTTTTPGAAYRYFKMWLPDGYRASNQSAIYEMAAYECTDCAATSTATSTPASNIADALMFELYVILDALFFIGCLIFGIWAMNKTFHL